MADLVSPGVQVQVIDESQYASSRISTIPYLLIATAENKINASGSGIAPGTLASTSGEVQLITSQRELVNTYGNPFFYKTINGDSIHGYELNEYGLMSAYSVLGVTNRAYVQRVDVDLAELPSTTVRPTGRPNNGTSWLETSEVSWGLFEWNSNTNSFVVQNEIITIIDPLQLDVSSIPLTSIGTVGSYAVVATNANNPVYYKNTSNDWVLVGSDEWKQSIPTITGTVANPVLTIGDSLAINGIIVTATSSSLIDFVTAINSAGITGITAAKVDNRIEIYVESGTGSGNSSIDTTVTIANSIVTTTGIAAELGMDEATYSAPLVQHASHTQIPRWRTTDTVPRPSGSLWFKTTNVNDGMNIVYKRYDATTDTFILQDVPVYENDQTANKWLDPATGGKLIQSGDTYAQFDVNGNNTGTLKIFERTGGQTSIIGNITSPLFTVGQAVDVSVSIPNDINLTVPVQVTMSGTSASDFVTDILAANIPYLDAVVTANLSVELIHTGGGVIQLEETLGSVAQSAGITSDLENVRDGVNRTSGNPLVTLSPWNVTSYSADSVEPGQDPIDGARWFNGTIDDFDIMIQDDGAWKGYRTVTNDVRGHDLTKTNLNGPMLSAIPPEAQDDDTPLVYGDLWIDSSDLEHYPKMYRWEFSDYRDRWVEIDLADQTSIDGILFADARWGIDESTDPITDAIVDIPTMLLSNYVDIDAPNPDVYPTGMLLWNMRRSGNNVKEFRTDYFNSDDFGAAVLPIERNAWVTISGLRDNGIANMGRHAQRAIVIEAMRAAVDASESLREEQRNFNLLTAPGYPEVIPNLVALNNERKNTGFIIGDAPMRLANNGNDLIEWATNNGGLGLNTGDGLVSNDNYLGVFYPAGKTNDLSGSEIIVPPSHMMLRTMIRSDDKAYPWFAPAGTRRGGVDNATAIGYIDSVSGEFQQLAVREAIRDVLYENNVNPITFLPGNGITNYGNKTTKSGGALDRINVARLVNYIRVQLDSLAKPFLFEPNDKITRDEIKNVVNGLMGDLMSKRAISDYSVVCDLSNNTPFRIDRNELWMDIAIVPIKAIEFIYLPLRIKNTGEI